MIEQFANDVKDGLSKSPKTLPSMYFYDKIGSALFAKIMQLPEYYLTDAEFEILSRQAMQIIDCLQVSKNQHFELIELGAGDGFKTIELLKVFEKLDYQYRYLPIDISQKALDLLGTTLQNHLPNLKLEKKLGDYFQILHELKNTHYPKVILFLGSNIGNMVDERANAFLKELSENLAPQDKIILGVDLIKSKEVVLPAYNDSQGLTRDFNLNLLSRINQELGGDFNINQFEHQPSYDEKEGIARSAIVSKMDQVVKISGLDLSLPFKKGEPIHTEISRKYNDAVLENICLNTGLNVIGKFTDSQNYFTDYILEKAIN